MEIWELGVADAKEVATEEEDGDEGFDLGWLPAFPHVLIASMSNFLFGYHIGLYSLSGYIYLCICMYWCVHACIRFICNEYLSDELLYWNFSYPRLVAEKTEEKGRGYNFKSVALCCFNFQKQ